MIKLNENKFQLIPEGTQVFHITEVKYDADFGKLEITLLTKDGLKDIERFQLIDNNGETNEKALNAFSYFCRMVMDDPNLAGDFDEQALVNKYVSATVEHQKVPSKKDPSKTNVFYKLSDYAAAKSFGDFGTDIPATADDFDF